MNATGKLTILVGCLVAALLPACGLSAGEWTLENIIERDYSDHCFRLPMDAPDGPFRVLEDGEEIPCTVIEQDGEKQIWVRTTIPAGGKHTYRVEPGKPKEFPPAVQVRPVGDAIELSNGQVAVRVPAAAERGTPCPITAVKAGGKWVGRGFWNTEAPLKSFEAEVLDDGRVFGRVRLRYVFDGPSAIDANTPAWAEVDVTVWPGCPFAIVSERHQMQRTDYWEFAMTAGWDARQPHFERHGSGFSGKRRAADQLATNQNPYWNPEVYGYLFPRWNQHSKDGWYFGLSDGSDRIGVLVIAAGKWYWPHDNAMEIRVKRTGDYAGLRAPTRRGRRYWFLTVGDNDPRQLGTRYALESLDFLVNELAIKDWPGVEGHFHGFWPLTGSINPTGGWRGRGKQAIRQADKVRESIEWLTHTQVLMHPNSYGSYWLFWSPENPNFFTDYMKVPLGYACTLRTHPRFGELAKMAEQVFHEDIYHSITLPGGAGNECPGYQRYAMGHYDDLAKVLRKHCGFDATKWPRYQAGPRFIAHISQPLGGGKRGLAPFGDTHPKGNVFNFDPIGFAREYGVNVNVRELKTEELPGFGVVFRNKAGTDDETFLAFKSGPSRGHYHGDQLAFHWCDRAKPLVVDHHCSYHPRAGQEHMHNRVAFHTPELPYANMDGYERVIAFKTSDSADVAVGQVSSYRLRKMEKLPPENWDQEYPRQELSEPLTYRRTVVLVKGGERDYFVLRDQYDSGRRPLGATYCLHVYGKEAKRSARSIDFGTLTCYVAEPARFAFANFDWEHDNGRHEETKGCRLTVQGTQRQFITVLYPGGDPPEMQPVAGGVQVGEDVITFDGGIDEKDDTTYVTVRTDGEELTLSGAEIDLDRDQGDVGLFVPDAGYPFGPIPAWLARQRLDVPDWAPDWVKELRKEE
jgi:hypothetical protein